MLHIKKIIKKILTSINPQCVYNTLATYFPVGKKCLGQLLTNLEIHGSRRDQILHFKLLAACVLPERVNNVGGSEQSGTTKVTATLRFFFLQ